MRKFLTFGVLAALIFSAAGSSASASEPMPQLSIQQTEVLDFVAEPGAKSQLILTAQARSWVLRNTLQNPRRIGQTQLFAVRLKDSKAAELVNSMPSDQVFADEIKYLDEPIVLTENISPATVSGVDTVGMIGANTVHSDGNTGAGTTVAILDTGIDPDHPYFKDSNGESRIVQEACFLIYGGDSSDNFPCLNGQSSQIGLGASDITNHAPSSAPTNRSSVSTSWTAGATSAQDWADAMSHGTHVAGLAAGASNTLISIPDTVPGGIAPDADIISIRIFGTGAGWYWDDYYSYWEFSPGGAYDSDIIAAVQWVTNNAATYNIAALNLSLGGGQYTTFCNDSIDNYFAAARAAGVAPMVATGNEYLNDAVSWPACAASAIAVGSVDGGGWTSDFSNTGEQIDLLAPGADVGSAVPRADQVYTFGYERWYGTSMATPVAAGAVALVKAARPDATIAEIEAALKATGTPVDDSLHFDIPRINVDLAIEELGPMRLDQTINVGGSTSAKIDETKTITATASSGLTVTASVVSTNVCSLATSSFANGTRTVTVTFSVADECEISFSQSGDSTYLPASVTHMIAVSKYDQTISVVVPSSGVFGGVGELRATSSSGLLPSALRSGLDAERCSITSRFEGATLIVSVAYNGAGRCRIQVSQSGNSLYAAAPAEIRDIQIGQASQSISVSTPNEIEIGNTFSVAPTATSGLTVVAESEAPSICTVVDFQVTSLGAGECVLRFSQSGNANFEAVAITRTINVAYQNVLRPTLLSPFKASAGITLRWKAPTNAAFSGLQSYRVRYRVAYPGRAFSSWVTKTVTSRLLKVTLKQTKYRMEYRVVAIAANSVSPAVSGTVQVK